MPLTALLPFAPAAGYLAVICLILLVARRCPPWVHLVGVALGAPAVGALTGWPTMAASLAAALGVLLIGVVVAARVLTGVGLFSLTATVALLPVRQWWVVGLGLMLAALVGVARTVQVAGVARVHHLVHETLLAMGWTPGGPVIPDPDRLPDRDDAAALVSTPADARRMRLYLPPYLLVGVAVGAALTATVLR